MAITKNTQLKTVSIAIVNTSMDTDASGDVSVAFNDLKSIVDARIAIQAGYIGQLQSVSGNIAKFRVYQDPGVGTGATAFVVKANGSDLAAGTATAHGYQR